MKIYLTNNIFKTKLSLKIIKYYYTETIYLNYLKKNKLKKIIKNKKKYS